MAITTSTLKKKRVWIPSIIVILLVIIGNIGWSFHDDPEFCTTCHIMDSYLETLESPPFLAHAHAENDLECLDCHPFNAGQSAGEVIAFVLHNYEDPLKQRKFPKEWCLECHEHGSYEEIAERTAYKLETVNRNPHDSHNGQINCYVCHKVHRESEDYCSNCHLPVSPDEGWITFIPENGAPIP